MPHLHVIGPPTYVDGTAPVTTDSTPSEPAPVEPSPGEPDHPTAHAPRVPRQRARHADAS